MFGVRRDLSEMNQGFPSDWTRFPRVLVKFDAGFREAISDQDFFHLVAMVSLQDDGVVLGSSAAGAVRFQFRCEVWKVYAFPVNTFNYGGGFSPFAHFHAYFYGLLLHADGAADAQVFGKATGRTDVGHSRSPVFPCNRPRAFYVRLAYLSVPSKGWIKYLDIERKGTRTARPFQGRELRSSFRSNDF